MARAKARMAYSKPFFSTKRPTITTRGRARRGPRLKAAKVDAQVVDSQPLAGHPDLGQELVQLARGTEAHGQAVEHAACEQRVGPVDRVHASSAAQQRNVIAVEGDHQRQSVALRVGHGIDRARTKVAVHQIEASTPKDSVEVLRFPG